MDTSLRENPGEELFYFTRTQKGFRGNLLKRTMKMKANFEYVIARKPRKRTFLFYKNIKAFSWQSSKSAQWRWRRNLNTSLRENPGEELFYFTRIQKGFRSNLLKRTMKMKTKFEYVIARKPQRRSFLFYKNMKGFSWQSSKAHKSIY